MNGVPSEALGGRVGLESGPRPMKHIAICVCTFKRPEMLHRLIASLQEQETGGSFHLSITVVDDARRRVSRRTVAAMAKGCRCPSIMRSEPRQEHLSGEEQRP
ncbi:MAG: hypothetical protein MZU91_11775 [Desulfosudis oleivorans]|nr:hypothetical protein [Desulfosudis oleivorans]